MADQTTIALKNSGSTGNTPVTLSLAYGELAINYADGKLFYRTSSDTLGSYSLLVPGITGDIIFNDGGVYGTSAKITFDKDTANLAVANVVTTKTINYNNQSSSTVGVYTTANTNSVIVDSFSTSTHRTARYTMQLTSGSAYHSEEITILHDGTTPRIVEYGVVYSNGSLGSFDVSISSGQVNLLFSPINAVTTLKYNKTLIVV